MIWFNKCYKGDTTMNNKDLEEIRNERKEFEKLLKRVEEVNSKIIENYNYYEAQKETKIAKRQAYTLLKDKYGYNVSIRTFRPDDLGEFIAGVGGISKTMGENDITVATGTTENTFSTTLPLNTIFVIKGIYLPKTSDIHTDYLSMYIGDAKQRWYPGYEIECTNKYGVYFGDPLVVKGGDTLKIKFLTTSDGLDSGKAKKKHQIVIKGCVLKAHVSYQNLNNATEEMSELKNNAESIIYKLKNIINR